MQGESGRVLDGATFLASLGSLVRWAPAQGGAGTIRGGGTGSGAPGGGGRRETLPRREAPVGPQGEGDGRQLFTICAGGDQTVCRALGSQAGLKASMRSGVPMGPGDGLRALGLCQASETDELSSEKRLSRHKSRSVGGFKGNQLSWNMVLFMAPGPGARSETSMKR